MPARGTIFFDASCGLCSAGARRWERTVGDRGFVLVPLQDPRASEVLHLTPGVLPSEMKLQTPAGDILGGVDAFAYVARYVWWAFPFHLLMAVAPLRDLAKLAYLPIAKHRRSISRVCRLRPMTEAT